MVTLKKKTRSRNSCPSESADPCSDYARAVVAGRIVAGKLVRLACQRHLDDLEHGHERGLKFDRDEANRVYKFFGLLRHSKGRWVRQPFTLEPWEFFVVGSIFGWKRADGSRRFRFAHVEVARKNGKTTVAAGIGLALATIDGEAGAEVYTIATKKDQAKLAHDESKRMVKASPALKKHIDIYRDALTVEATDSKYIPLGADADTLDGLNISGAICDELHAWKLRDLWDVIETATGARTQPLILSTTTAGTGRLGIWWERRELAVKILAGLITGDGAIAADAVFAAIYTLDDEDDWADEKNWIKANPSLGVSLAIQELRERCEEAKATPGKQNSFKRLRLNVPTQQDVLWLDLARWDKCGSPVSWDELAGRQCFSGLDLSATTDMTALAHVFPPVEQGEPWKVLMRFWLPGDNLEDRCRRDLAPYDVWKRDGFLETTDGDVVDYNVIEARVKEDADRFQIQQLAIDRYLANQLTTRLMDDGLPVEGFGQGFASMAAPCRELEILITSARLAHGGHPVLRFNAGCASVRMDPAGNRKPDKAHSTGRIDGLVALLMGLGKAIVVGPGGSVYDTRGIETLNLTDGPTNEGKVEAGQANQSTFEEIFADEDD